MSEPIDNGRATIREVYALVGELRADIATVDAKVDSLQANETRLAILERMCADRPTLCALMRDEVARKAIEQNSERGWALIQRYGWLIATAIATASAVIGWTH
jgi:hypothetical protein